MGSDSTAMTSAPRELRRARQPRQRVRPPTSPPPHKGGRGVRPLQSPAPRVGSAEDEAAPTTASLPTSPPPLTKGGLGGSPTSVDTATRALQVRRSQAHPRRVSKSKSKSKTKSKSATTAPILRVQLPEDIRHVPSPIANDGRRSAAHTARHVPASESHSVPPRRPTSGGPFDFCQQFQPRCQVMIRPFSLMQAQVAKRVKENQPTARIWGRSSNFVG